LQETKRREGCIRCKMQKG